MYLQTSRFKPNYSELTPCACQQEQRRHAFCWLASYPNSRFTQFTSTSLVPWPCTPPVFDHLQYAKIRGRRPGEFHHVIRSTTVIHHHSSSTAKWRTRSILHSVLDTKPAESYTKHVKRTQAKSHDSKRLLSDKHKNAQKWCNYLVEWKDGNVWSWHHLYDSHPLAVKLQTRICFTSWTGGINRATYHMIKFPRLFLLPFLHTASNQKSDVQATLQIHVVG